MPPQVKRVLIVVCIVLALGVIGATAKMLHVGSFDQRCGRVENGMSRGDVHAVFDRPPFMSINRKQSPNKYGWTDHATEAGLWSASSGFPGGDSMVIEVQFDGDGRVVEKRVGKMAEMFHPGP
jgi:hypothetical protein